MIYFTFQLFSTNVKSASQKVWRKPILRMILLVYFTFQLFSTNAHSVSRKVWYEPILNMILMVYLTFHSRIEPWDHILRNPDLGEDID